MAAPYRVTAVAMEPDSSSRRASSRRCVAPDVPGTSPRNGILGEMGNLPGDGPMQGIVDRGDELEDLEIVRHIGNALGNEEPEPAAICIAHRERRGLLELQPLG